MLTLWNIVIIVFATSAAASDMRSRRIPRWLTISGFCMGLLFHWRFGHLLNAAQAAFVGFVIGLVLFSLGAIGGGDVKLMTALGAMMGLQPWMRAMYLAVFAAAAMALIQVIRRRALRQTVGNIGEIFRSFYTVGLSAHPQINVKNPALIRSPFGVAAAVGVLLAVMKF